MAYFKNCNIKILPPYTANKESNTFANMFIIICKNCLSSSISILSKAKDDIVVSEPQKPIAIKKEYFESRPNRLDKTEKIPRIKLPIIFTTKTFEPIIPNMMGKEVILYLVYAPTIAPTANRANSIDFILKLQHH